MPISRKKSCVQCRLAKSRCNLNEPCSRCTDRGLRCEYTGSYSRPAPYDRLNIRPELLGLELTDQRPSGSPRWTNAQPSSCIVRSQFDSILENSDGFESIDQEPGELANGSFPDNFWPAESEGVNLLECTWSHPNTTPYQTQQMMPTSSTQGPQESFNPQSSLLESMAHNKSYTVSPLAIQQVSPVDREVQSHDDDRQTENDITVVSSPFPSSSIGYAAIFSQFFHQISLSPKKTLSSKAYLATQILIGQISAYPKLLIQGSLPPYLYPSCVFDGILPKNCAVDGTHRCLSEPLKTCASLLSLFYATGHTKQNRSIIWKAIYEELDQLKNEVCPITSLISMNFSMRHVTLLANQPISIKITISINYYQLFSA